MLLGYAGAGLAIKLKALSPRVAKYALTFHETPGTPIIFAAKEPVIREGLVTPAAF